MQQMKTKLKEKTAQRHQDVALNKMPGTRCKKKTMKKCYVGFSDSQGKKESEDGDKRDVTVSWQPETDRGREGNEILHPSRSPFTAVTCLIIKARERCLVRCCLRTALKTLESDGECQRENQRTRQSAPFCWRPKGFTILHLFDH